jgi:hypothetical protein
MTAPLTATDVHQEDDVPTPAYDEWLGRTGAATSRVPSRPSTRVLRNAARGVLGAVTAGALLVLTGGSATAASSTPINPGDNIFDPAAQEDLTRIAMVGFCLAALALAMLIIGGMRRAERRRAEAAAEVGANEVRPEPFRGEVTQLFDVDVAAEQARKRLSAVHGRQRESVWSGTSW